MNSLFTDNNEKVILLLLDLDGVLITTPPWKREEQLSDGYSAFSKNCVSNLNRILELGRFEIWLSSSRRKAKTILEFNQIFDFRGINQSITGMLPEYPREYSRKQELESFLSQKPDSSFLILDDDKSLNDLDDSLKKYLVQTQFLKGFNDDSFLEASNIVIDINRN